MAAPPSSPTGISARSRYGPCSSHACLFTDDGVASWRTRARLISGAQSSGWRVAYVTELPDATVHAGLGLDGRACPTVPAAAFGLDLEPVPLTRVAAELRARAAAARASGQRGMFAMIDMRWVLRTPSAIAFLERYEAMVHELTAAHPLRVACLYDTGTLLDRCLMVGLHAHRVIAGPDRTHTNPHFLPPSVILSSDLHSRLQHWLGALDPKLRLAEPPGGRPTDRQHEQISSAALPSQGVDTGMPPWRVHLLGETRVQRDDGTVVTWSAPGTARTKVKTLFAFLHVRGARGATADELAVLLWPDAPAGSDLRNRLHQTVHSLRVALSGGAHRTVARALLRRDGDRYTLALPPGTWLDAAVFEQLCARSVPLIDVGDYDRAIAVLRAADQLYQGDFLSELPECYVSDGDDDWCWNRRHWLRQMYVKAERTLAGLMRGKPDLLAATLHCRKALDADPASDEAHQEMMHILHAERRSDAVRRQYEVYVRSAASMGVRPSDAVTRTYIQLLHGAPAAPPCVGADRSR